MIQIAPNDRCSINMIRILLKQQLDEKSFKERRRITLHELSEKTGISRATLNRIANVPGHNTNTDTIDQLCQFFECEITDLVTYINDKK